MTQPQPLTPATLELFLGLAEDASNWSGMPLITVTPQQKGNLTHLKQRGLLNTMVEDDGCAFALFTKAGVAFAAEHGIDLAWISEIYDPA